MESSPRLTSLDRRVHNLPVQAGELLGRKADVEDVLSAVQRHRLVSLLGLGGMGKTRLAVAAAAELVGSFADGVWFIDLVPVTDPSGLAETIAATIGLVTSGRSDPLEELATLASQRQMLLVLDNCEDLLDGVAEAVELLLASAPRLQILATSREPLGLADERQIHVTPLEVDEDVAAPAVALFATAAERVGVSVGAADVTTVAAICRQLDGLPLAIELAASQARFLSFDDIASRLDRRFELLEVAGRRGRGQRQASLLHVLEGTWSLLDDRARVLLVQLAAFPGPFDLDAVEGVAGGLDVGVAARTLGSLVDYGVVAAVGDGRFRLLETVKLFARERERGSDIGDAARRHATWCVRYLAAQPYEARHTSSELAAWVTQHHDDLLAAESHFLEVDAIDEVVELLCSQSYAVTDRMGGAHAAATVARVERLLATRELGQVDRGRLHVTMAGTGLAARRPDWFVRASHACELLGGTDRPIDLAAAMIVTSWMTALRDPDAALGILDEAIEAAANAGAPTLANAARSYRASHLVVALRLDEGREELNRLRGHLGDKPFDYGWNNYFMVSCSALRRSSRLPLRRMQDVGWPSERGRGACAAVAALPQPSRPVRGRRALCCGSTATG